MQIQLARSILLCCCMHCGAALALDDTPLQNSYRLPRVADGRSSPVLVPVPVPVLVPASARRSMAAGLSLAPALPAGADLPARASRAGRRKALARPAQEGGVGTPDNGIAVVPAADIDTGLRLR